MSNVYENKGNSNTHLKEWCEENGWVVKYFEDFQYNACGRSGATVEVCITNKKD